MMRVDKNRVNFDSENEAINFEVDGKKQKGHSTWFRGEHTNYNPALENMQDQDAALRHVLQGWLPERPKIGPNTKVTAFGSCFAANISKWLAERDFSVLTDKSSNSNAYIVRFGEGMVNTFVIRQQFEWAFQGKTFEEDLWHGYSAEAYGYDENIRQKTKEIFEQTDIFILTLGLSEVWYDENTGGVFWRAVPQEKYDPTRHKFRVSSVQENYLNLKAIYDLIRKYRPEANIIFTLSPIPLVATFRPVSCITANSASKAILRSALDEFMREVGEEGVAYYWPSYEIVLDVFDNRWKADRRHVKKPILDFIMTLFEHTWCYETSPRYTVLEAWLRALSMTGKIPKGIFKALENRNLEEIKLFEKKFREKEATSELLMLREFLNSQEKD